MPGIPCSMDLTADYEQWATNKVPTIKETHVVLRGENSFVAWFHCQIDGIDSSYYMQVDISALKNENESESTTLISWHLIPANPSWPYGSQGAPRQLKGSLKLESLGNQTKLAYNLVIQPDTGAPGFVVKRILSSTLKSETNYLFQLMAN